MTFAAIYAEKFRLKSQKKTKQQQKNKTKLALQTLIKPFHPRYIIGKFKGKCENSVDADEAAHDKLLHLNLSVLQIRGKRDNLGIIFHITRGWSGGAMALG